MSEVKKDVKKTKKRKQLSRSAIILIVGLFIIAIPIIIFLAILGISALQTGSPRDGSRFDNDLDPKITDSDLSSIENELNTISSVDEIEVILSEGQLKIYIDTNDNLDEQQIDSIISNAYNIVNSKLPVSTYFTATDSRKMYDLQINVYTVAEASPIGAENSRQYKLLHKNSTESQYSIDDLAHPKDPNLAAELEGLVPKAEEGETEGETQEGSNG